ncbi:MAG: hypothetical protein WCO56_08435, partial [Verrucomicrobiota bacterium]
MSKQSILVSDFHLLSPAHHFSAGIFFCKRIWFQFFCQLIFLPWFWLISAKGFPLLWQQQPGIHREPIRIDFIRRI